MKIKIKTKRVVSFICCLLLIFLLSSSNVLAFGAQNADKDMQDQLKRIDKLAQKYYDYYVKQGYIVDGKLVVDVGKLKDVYLDEQGKVINDDQVSTNSVSTGQAVQVLADMGVYMTESKVAQECAILGAIIAADGPLPVGDFLALCVGVFFICNHISSIIANEYNIVNEIRVGVSSTCANNATKSIGQAKTQQRNQNYFYFEAWRYNGPGGGIVIGNPLSESQAVSRLKAGLDVWSRSQTLALNIAQKASANGQVVYHSPHNTSKYPLNLPHYHDYYHYNGHSFFGGNYH